MDDDLKYNQVRFEEACISTMESFFKSVCSKSANYNQKNLKNLRDSMNWDEDQDYLSIAVARERVVYVYVRWVDSSFE